MDEKAFFKINGLITINQFFAFCNQQFDYGWISQSGGKFYGTNDAKSYWLQSPKELLDSRLGICWDMTELYRCFFQLMTNLNGETYYLYYDDNQGCPSHSIFVFYSNHKVYWFEPRLESLTFDYSGIHEYRNIKELLTDFKNKLIKYLQIEGKIPINYQEDDIHIYQYERPRYHINGYEMRQHIDHSKKINI